LDSYGRTIIIVIITFICILIIIIMDGLRHRFVRIGAWLMLASFVQGMSESGSVAGTALSTAANFSCSAALGYMLWSEHYSRTWWFGFGMVLLGTYLLSTVGIVHVENGNDNDNTIRRRRLSHCQKTLVKGASR
jgi:MFS family permease